MNLGKKYRDTKEFIMM